MSSKTPNEQPKETASALKDEVKNTKKLTAKIAFIGFIIIFISINLFVLYNFLTTPTITAPNGRIYFETADNYNSRKLGLSGKDSIGSNEGLLFVFEDSSIKNCFWMKDMKFPIDMVWLDDDKQVVSVKESVSPTTYPDTFCPEAPAKYGLELLAGKSKDFGIEAGVKLSW
jgi:uncharacterized membrane protein (UPF0127 family)